MPGSAAHGFLVGAEVCSYGWLEAMHCCRPPATMPPYQEWGVFCCLLHHPRHLASCINRLCESHPWDL